MAISQIVYGTSSTELGINGQYNDFYACRSAIANGIPPPRGSSLIITGCITPVPYYSFGIPNTCSYPWEVQVPHGSVYTHTIGPASLC